MILKPKVSKMKIGNRILKIKECHGIHSLTGLMFDKMNGVDGAFVHANNVWMPFVKRKLDLFFVDKKLRIVDVQKAIPMTWDPRTWRVHANWKAKYCLEIKSGLVKGNHIGKKFYFKRFGK